MHAHNGDNVFVLTREITEGKRPQCDDGDHPVEVCVEHGSPVFGPVTRIDVGTDLETAR